jgi:hypothetical protein
LSLSIVCLFWKHPKLQRLVSFSLLKSTAKTAKQNLLDPLIWAHLYPWKTKSVLSSEHILTRTTDDRNRSIIQNVAFDELDKMKFSLYVPPQ